MGANESGLDESGLDESVTLGQEVFEHLPILLFAMLVGLGAVYSLHWVAEFLLEAAALPLPGLPQGIGGDILEPGTLSEKAPPDSWAAPVEVGRGGSISGRSPL